MKVVPNLLGHNRGNIIWRKGYQPDLRMRTVNQDIIGKNQELSGKSGMFLGLPFQNMNDVINNLE